MRGKRRTWQGSSSASPPPCPVPSPSPPRQPLCHLLHCLQQLQHGWHKHPQPVLRIKGSRCKTLSPPCILASRKPGQVRMFVWLKSAFHQLRSSGRIHSIEFGHYHLDNFCERRWNIVFNVGKRRQQKTWHCEQASSGRSDNPQGELILLKGKQRSRVRGYLARFHRHNHFNMLSTERGSSCGRAGSGRGRIRHSGILRGLFIAGYLG